MNLDISILFSTFALELRNNKFNNLKIWRLDL